MKISNFSDELVKAGKMEVKEGNMIGNMGNTGGVKTTAGNTQKLNYVTEKQRNEGCGTHLNWDKKVNGVFVDPLGEY